MRRLRSTLLALTLPAFLLSAGCGEEPTDATSNSPDLLLPSRPDDKLIDDTGRPERVDEDPTPQAGTSGAIPGYEPLVPDSPSETDKPADQR